MPGRALGVMTSQSCGETLQLLYIATTVSQHLFIATIPCILTAVTYRIRVGSSSGTFQIVKCPTGTAPANGTVITSAIDISATPTADTTLTAALTVGNNSSNVTLNTGDSLAVVIGGTMTSGVGLIQLFVEPVS